MSQEIELPQAQIQNMSSSSDVEDTSLDQPIPATDKGKGKEKELSQPLRVAPSTDSSAPAPAEEDVDKLWPLEHFPPAPADGHWLPKFGPIPPSKFLPRLTDEPPSQTLPLDPPLMALTYPPPPPLSEDDPTWLGQMTGDVSRQHSWVEVMFAKLQAEVADATIDSDCADIEIASEMELMQGFLTTVASVAGNGFVRRLLEDIDFSVKLRTGEVVPGEEKGEATEDVREGDDDENAPSDDEHHADDEDSSSDEDGDDNEDGMDGGALKEDEVADDETGGLVYPPDDESPEVVPEETEDASGQPEVKPENEAAPEEPLSRAPHASDQEAEAKDGDEVPLPCFVPGAEPYLRDPPALPAQDKALESDERSPKSSQEICEEVLSQLKEPLDVKSITRRFSRPVGPKARRLGVESSRDHGPTRRKRSFLGDDAVEDSEEDSDSSNRSKRAKLSHESSPSPLAGPSRKRSRESMESEEDELDELDSEEEVSVQVTPRPGRDDSLLSLRGAKGRGKARAQPDSSGSPKRARTDKAISSSLPAGDSKSEKVDWFKTLVAQASTPSRQAEASGSGSVSPPTSQALVLYGTGPSAPAAPSQPSPSLTALVLAPPQAPPPPIQSLSTSTQPVAQRRRPLRRATSRLRENAFGEPEIFHVHDLRGNDPIMPTHGRALRRQTRRGARGD
ncbi:hypothetical protein HYDPIDRAFT_165906 [Hydnomerulius pinastri MD-312]|nr:hypothetical protein HYDPIDRAFT_165906 [Hydnomerulius pinastri MD-312]